MVGEGSGVALIFAVARSAGVGQDVADVGDAGDEHEEAFESCTEAGVRYAAEAAEVDIP